MYCAFFQFKHYGFLFTFSWNYTQLYKARKSTWLVYCSNMYLFCVPGPPGRWNIVVPGRSRSPAQSLSSWTPLISWTAATPPCCPLWWKSPQSMTTRWLTPSGVQHINPFVCSHCCLSLYPDRWKVPFLFWCCLLLQAWTMKWIPKVSCDSSFRITVLCLNNITVARCLKTHYFLNILQKCSNVGEETTCSSLHSLFFFFLTRKHHHCRSEHHPDRPHSDWPRWLCYQSASPGGHQVLLSRLRAEHKGAHVPHLVVLLHNSTKTIRTWRSRNLNSLFKSAET